MGLGCFTSTTCIINPLIATWTFPLTRLVMFNMDSGFKKKTPIWAHENRVKDISRNVCFCQKAIRDVTNRLSEASVVTQGGIVTFRALCSQAIVLLSSNLYSIRVYSATVFSPTKFGLSCANLAYLLHLSLLHCTVKQAQSDILSVFIGNFLHLVWSTEEAKSCSKLKGFAQS